MKRLTFIIVVFLSTVLYSQSILNENTVKFSSLDMITDAKNLALGESFVANDESPTSFFVNPAALYNRERLNIFYNYRSHGWINTVKNANFSSIGGTIKLPFWKFGVMYNRFSSGKYSIDPTNPNSMAQSNYNTFIISNAADLSSNFTVGANAKIFNYSFSTTGQNIYSIESNNSFLFDFGIIWRIGDFFNEANYNDYFKIGASIQNYGTDYEEEYKFILRERTKGKVARFLRTGFSYNANMILGYKTQISFELLLTGEYKRLLNAGVNEKHNVDYWGIGLEATIFKMMSLRIGGVINHESNIIYERGKFMWRYGAGLNFPLALLGLNKPIIIHFDFASIPFNKIELIDFYGKRQTSKESLYAFGISFSYWLNPYGN
jgi:hypothetical protein